jgi:hypothetical protein
MRSILKQIELNENEVENYFPVNDSYDHWGAKSRKADSGWLPKFGVERFWYSRAGKGLPA